MGRVDSPLRAKLAEFKLSQDEVQYLEELYVPHSIGGVMAQSKPSDSGKGHVWLANAKYLEKEKVQ